MANKNKSKIGPVTVSRTYGGKPLYPKTPYKNMADAILGTTRGNLGRVIMKKPKQKPKITPINPSSWRPGPKYKPSNGVNVGP